MRSGTCALLLGALCLSVWGCGSPATPTPINTALTLLDTSIALVQGQNCNVGGASRDFNGLSGKTVVITATGVSGMRLNLVLYAPDYATQLAAAGGDPTGVATMVIALTQSGAHHVGLCEVNGAAGTVRLTVTEH